MKICFVSNYINHHQIPFCNRMQELTQNQFVFIQTQPMEADRVAMGWQESSWPEYVHFYYEEEAWCQAYIDQADVMIFGGCEDECYVAKRLVEKKPVIRISERLYREGQWKAISPRGLVKKYKDHTSHRKDPVYLLCAGGYVPSDFHIVRAYKDKMFQWGYFTETKKYDIDQLIAKKGYVKPDGSRVPYILWTARLIPLKHPEKALEAAAYLKEKGIDFHMDIIGGGEMEKWLCQEIATRGLLDEVTPLGFKKPSEVRQYMEQANVFLFTSDRNEGWGAVANESMNSGCAIVMNHMIGAAPYLIQQGKNGFVYEDGNDEMFLQTVERLVLQKEETARVGKCAYDTITKTWNAENAANRLMDLIENTILGNQKKSEPVCQSYLEESAPCNKAVPISERKMFSFLVNR